MKKILFVIAGILLLYNLYLGSASVRSGEINFFNDVSRDFLLLQELDYKKIVLIGPRSSTAGLFHGPLWTYVNYPAYLLGHGDPVVIAWFWQFLEIAFLIGCFFLAKKLFGNLIAFAYVLILSSRLIPHINGIFHSEATFFITPFLFFTIERYVTTKKNIFLIIHLIITSALIQLEIGDGIPFLALSTVVAFFVIYKNKLWKHLLSFLIVPLCLINLILFDIKHELRMFHAIISTGTGQKYFVTIPDWIKNRIENIVSLELLDSPEYHMPLLIIIFFAVIAGSIYEIKKRSKYARVYALFLFYFLGYITMSYFNKGLLLYHYVYLLIPITTLWLVSFLRKGKFVFLFVIFSIAIYLLTYANGTKYITDLQNSFQDKNPNSWRGLSSVADEIVKRQKNEEFGYFVYSPDAFAYQPRYAMIYNFQNSKANAFEYQKKATTYVVAQPPPANNPYMEHDWWIKVKAGIKNDPTFTKKMPNGYTILEYHLTPDEQKIPHEKNIELGISFR